MVVYVPLSANPRAITIIAVLWPMVTLSGVFLGLRLYSKLTRSRRLWWDDHFIIFAWITLLCSCASSTANVRLGFGLHDEQVPFENLITFGLLSNISGFMSVIAVTCSKTSFAITLLRLTDGWMKWFIITLMVIHNIGQVGSALFFWIDCNPPAKTWDPILPGDCWPTSVTVDYSEFVGACSAFCDFALALLPWRLLLRYNMYNREKIGVAIAMSMGVIAGVACIVKLTTIPILNDGDFSYNSLPLVVWGFIEPSLTIVAASIPMMRHLFKSLHHDSYGSSASSTSDDREAGVPTLDGLDAAHLRHRSRTIITANNADSNPATNNNTSRNSRHARPHHRSRTSRTSRTSRNSRTSRSRTDRNNTPITTSAARDHDGPEVQLQDQQKQQEQQQELLQQKQQLHDSQSERGILAPGPGGNSTATLGMSPCMSLVSDGETATTMTTAADAAGGGRKLGVRF